MFKIVNWYIGFALVICSSLALAKEPGNLADYKRMLVHYHDSGAYNKDIDTTINQALHYLNMKIAQAKKPAIVLDIDETSLSNYADMQRLDFGGTIEEIRADEDKGSDPAIEPTLRLYNYAKAHHVAVFFITGRHENERAETIHNLEQAGYKNWDGLILRNATYTTAPASVYKTAYRKQLAAQGYDIILNIGDQKSDLAGGYADKGFKLPNPYYFIP
jgi:predicted secreted acid phosphatase